VPHNATEAALAAGVKYVTLWRWTDAGYIKAQAAVDNLHGTPGDPAAPGSGYSRRYTDAEVDVLKRMALLVRIGVRPSCAVRIAREWAEHPAWPVYLGEGVTMRIDAWHPEHMQHPEYVAASRAAESERTS